MSIRLAIAAAALMLAGLIGWAWRDNSADAEMATIVAQHAKELAGHERAAREASERARLADQQRVEDVAALAHKYERDLQDAQDRSDRRIDGLESGNVRLRREIGALYTERLSRDSSAAGELSEAAQRGATLVAEAIGIGAEADAQVKALQEAYEAMRRHAPELPE